MSVPEIDRARYMLGRAMPVQAYEWLDDQGRRCRGEAARSMLRISFHVNGGFAGVRLTLEEAEALRGQLPAGVFA